MKTFNDYCADLGSDRQILRIVEEIVQNNLDMESIVQGAMEDLIRQDPDKAQVLIEQSGFMHTLGRAAGWAGKKLKGMGQEFAAGFRGEPLIEKALKNFLRAAHQAGYNTKQIMDTVQANMDQQKVARQQAGAQQVGTQQGQAGAPAAETELGFGDVPAATQAQQTSKGTAWYQGKGVTPTTQKGQPELALAPEVPSVQPRQKQPGYTRGGMYAPKL